MRLSHALDDLLSDRSQVRVLRALWSSREWSSGRAVAKIAGVSAAQTGRALQRLLDVGIVEARGRGRAFLWRWNDRHVLAPAMGRLFADEASLRSTMIHDLTTATQDLGALDRRLFGSFATHAERMDSDVDILLVVRNRAQIPTLDQELDPLRRLLMTKYGNPLSPVIVTLREIKGPRFSSLSEAVETEGVALSPVGGAHGEG